MTTVSSLFQSFLPQQPPTDPFMAGLSQVGAQVSQLAAQVAQAGAGARSNSALIQSFNALVGQVQQYQQAVTQAGPSTNPAYQQAINAMAAQLNQVLAVLNGSQPAATQQPDAFTSGLNQLAGQVGQLQAQVAAAGASAGQNQQLRAAHQQLSQSVNAYLGSLRNAGAAYANSPQMATLNDLAARLAAMQAAFAQVAPASWPQPQPTYLQPQPQYPGYPQPQYPQPQPQYPGGVQPPRNQNADRAMQIIGVIGAVAGIINGQRQQPGGWQGQIR